MHTVSPFFPLILNSPPPLSPTYAPFQSCPLLNHNKTCHSTLNPSLHNGLHPVSPIHLADPHSATSPLSLPTKCLSSRAFVNRKSKQVESSCVVVMAVVLLGVLVAGEEWGICRGWKEVGVEMPLSSCRNSSAFLISWFGVWVNYGKAFHGFYLNLCLFSLW